MLENYFKKQNNNTHTKREREKKGEREREREEMPGSVHVQAAKACYIKENESSHFTFSPPDALV